MEPAGGRQAPGHSWGVVGEAESAIRAEEDDSTVAAEAVEEVRDGFAGGDIWHRSRSHAVGCPLAEDQLHDRLAPTGERDRSRQIVGIAAAADERGVAHAAGSFVEGSACRGCRGQVAAAIEGYGPYGVMRVFCAVLVLGWAAATGMRREGRGRVFVVAEDVGRLRAGEGFVAKAGSLAGLCVLETLALPVEVNDLQLRSLVPQL